jgi:putative membrane protein
VNPWHALLTAWAWDPGVVIGCAALLVGYLAALRFRYTPQIPRYVAGVVILGLALVSPLDILGDMYLFSAHMLQHMLLILVVPPLLILGIPATVWRRGLGLPGVARAELVLSQPLFAWLLAVGTLWLWHLPALYQAALEREPVHIGQHLSFLVTATIFWWPVLTPVRERRLAVPPTLLYLLAGAAANTLLGILLTFAPAGLYPAYRRPVDLLGLLPLIRQEWGLTPTADQQLGGLLMWVPGGLIFLGVVLATLVHWLGSAEEVEEPERSQAEAPLPVADPGPPSSLARRVRFGVWANRRGQQLVGQARSALTPARSRRERANDAATEWSMTNAGPEEV